MHTITAKITREVRVFQAGEYTGFNIGLGEQYYDRQTKQKVWTNYKVTVFAKEAQAKFYQDNLIVGTVVKVSAEHQKIDNYNPEYLSIEFIDAKLGGIFTQNSGVQNSNNAPQQNQQSAQAPQQQQQQNHQQADQQMSDDLPF